MPNLAEPISAANLLIALIIGVTGVIGIFFGIAVFVVRSKDMQALKPQIDKLPLIESTMNTMREDIGEMKGILSVVPAIQASVEHHATDIRELRERVRDLEKK